MNKHGLLSHNDFYMIIKNLICSKTIPADDRKALQRTIENNVLHPNFVWCFLSSHELYSGLIGKRRINNIEELIYYADEYHGKKDGPSTKNWSDTYCPKQYQK